MTHATKPNPFERFLPSVIEAEVATAVDPEAELRKARAERAQRYENIQLARVPLEDDMPRRIAARDLEPTVMLRKARGFVDVARNGFLPRVTALFASDVGRGKTVAGAVIIAELGHLFGAKYSTLEHACHLSDRGATIPEKAQWRELLSVPILVLDEIGWERRLVDGGHTFKELLDWRAQLFTVCITNLNRSDLDRRYDTRALDRLQGRLEEETDAGPSFRHRRPWREVLGFREDELVDAARIDERYRELRDFWAAKASDDDDHIEDRVELSACRYRAIAETRAPRS